MKLSIITINYNNSTGLSNTIRSVIGQTFSDYEYIIIDGGSDDDSLEVIKKHNNRINHWVSEPDKGIYSAMNKGIMHASGEYLLFLNSGDCFVNNGTLSKVFSKNHTEDLLVGDCIFKKKKEEKLKFPFPYRFYNVMIFQIPNHQSTFIKKDLFTEIGLYDESLKIAGDWKFFLLAVFKFNKSYIALREYVALMDASGISSTKEGKDRLKEERNELLEQYFPCFYDDYKDLHKVKRFEFNHLKKYTISKIKKFIYQ